MDHRTRRAHKKSRNGCSKCRERRIKCDEGSPRCSRCEKKDMSCDYPKKRQTGVLRRTKSADQEAQQSCSPNGTSPPSNPTTPYGAPCSPTASETTGRSVDVVQSLSESVMAEAASCLDPLDFELFQHFLDHTSKDTTVDLVDQYTLQVGIPGLALQSTFLLKSVLALSCICKCRDIINSPPSSLFDSHRQTVMNLLRRAELYHMDSMHEVGGTRHEASHYDHILANAAMMGMYGSASHWVRIWLLQTSAPGHQKVLEFPPSSTQWTRLFRAVTTAYTGLRFDAPAKNILGIKVRSPGQFPTLRNQASSERSAPLTDQMEHQRGPSKTLAFHSIVAATFQSAMSRLRVTTNRMLIVEGSVQMLHLEEGPTVGDHRAQEDLRACLAALEILDDIMTHNFLTQDKTNNKTNGFTSRQSTPSLDMPDGLVEQLSSVSPWLQSYVSRITSTVPTRLPRRYIAAFIHKAPLRFLDIVDEAFASTGRVVDGYAMQETRRLAFNIFAHWLVLVLLLDDVWWIGGIAAWELGIIALLVRDGQGQHLMYDGYQDKWWPESMFEIWKCLEYFSK
ncbi:hypothetical protein B0T18DRAFT_357034 [Schizothecium vesticola]|uniref:Zn(2)-C6 fungal-type domain-containing protein n=1 Tax=Schizothecium vesticola TaxID=314040 RepID=A0AA40FDA0_9PEZI|nr:hypothetical protein B0T18DRAFT_357034 [Schizothecium vesticola]